MVKSCLSLLYILLVLPGVLAHETNDPVHDAEHDSLQDLQESIETKRSMSTSYAVIWPWYYFARGEWHVGLIAIGIWALLLKAFYDLFIIVFGRLISVKKVK